MFSGCVCRGGHSCVSVHVPWHARGCEKISRVLVLTFHLVWHRDSLLFTGADTRLAGPQTSKGSPVSPPILLGLQMCSSTPSFTWFMGFRTQGFTLMQQALYPLSHLPRILTTTKEWTNSEFVKLRISLLSLFPMCWDYGCMPPWPPSSLNEHSL